MMPRRLQNKGGWQLIISPYRRRVFTKIYLDFARNFVPGTTQLILIIFITRGAYKCRVFSRFNHIQRPLQIEVITFL